jgi:hypothetical protein
MSLCSRSLLASASLCLAATLPAADAFHLERTWTRRFDGGVSIDMGSSVRTGPDGSVYVSGFTDAAGTFDLHTLCYSPGGEVLWQATYNSGGDDVEPVLAGDPHGDLTVAAQAASPAGQRYVVLRYDADGRLLWETYLDGAASLTRHQLQVLVDSTSETTYLATILASAPSVAAIDAVGDVLWTKAIPHAEGGESVHAALDADGSIVASAGGGVARFGPDGSTRWAAPIQLEGLGRIQIWSVALDREGAAAVTGDAGRQPVAARLDRDGRVLWVRRVELPGHPGGAGWQVLFDPSGDIVLGLSADSDVSEDIGAARLDRDGHLLWSATYDGPAHGADQHAEMALDAAGRVFIAGMTTTACDDPVCNPFSSFTTDYALLVYGPDGALVARDLYDGEDDAGGDGPDWPNSLALGPDGAVHVTGFSWSDAGLFDFLTIRHELAAGPPPSPPFRRGDADGDSAVRLTDAIAILLHLFQGGAAPGCARAADIDDSGALNVTDPVFLLDHLFRGGVAPPVPGGACGQDLTPDALSCGASGGCAG